MYKIYFRHSRCVLGKKAAAPTESKNENNTTTVAVAVADAVDTINTISKSVLFGCDCGIRMSRWISCFFPSIPSIPFIRPLISSRHYTVLVRLFSMHFSLVNMSMQKCIVNSPYNRLIMFVRSFSFLLFSTLILLA